MEDVNKKIIEINGVKIEVDLRTAKKIDHYAIGDTVKVLKKKYSDSYTTRYGVIVDFGLFKKRPSIEILSIPSSCSYGEDALQFDVFNADSEDLEIAPLSYLDEVFCKNNVIAVMDDEMDKAKLKLIDMEKKKELFMRYFGKYFQDVPKEEVKE